MISEASIFQMNLVADLDKELIGKLKEKGMQFTFPDPEAFRKATVPVYEVFYSKFGDRARQIVEAIKNM